MNNIYESILADCNAAAAQAACETLLNLLPDCSDEVLDELLQDVQGGYLLEDGRMLSWIVEEAIELRQAKRLVSAYEALAA